MNEPKDKPAKDADKIGFRPKRFWKEAAFARTPEGFAVTLDGRPAKTPAGKTLALPNFALAAKVAAEWNAVGEVVEFNDMPLTRLSYAAIDRMGDTLEETLSEVSRYAETDLLCYPADYPAELTAREASGWNPILDWAHSELGLRFEQNLSIVHKPQPETTVAALKELVAQAGTYERAGIMAATPLFGSVILALALFKGHLTGNEAHSLSRIGEAFQAETWGDDAEASTRADNHRAQAQSLEDWFKALKV
ncbi:ATP12 family chaperone protein [Asticcacaulis endophyticus]|uniref:ATPase n=1 Tax=Asticcacaulis endophyticus TaxID=1395890 RepID=A0A918Q6M5_9CAUL|nr:ATP12 family protein [Asticcacaulis endophyticus]GGZ35085.1 ATPase [Asticcacaulis endophyticus]